jgi:hypothetical protein
VQQPKLTDLLKSASKEQLVSLVLELNGQVPGLEGRVAALLPPPDLTVRGLVAGWVGREGTALARMACGTADHTQRATSLKTQTTA